MAGPFSILLVAKDFFPLVSPRSFRATELAREFANRGHRVKVFALGVSTDTQEFAKEHGFTVAEIGPLRLRPPEAPPGSQLGLLSRIAKRGLRLFFEIPDIELVSRIPSRLAGESPFDLAISFASPHPVHWGMKRAVQQNPNLCTYWIADCGDPYMHVTLDTFRKPFYFKYFEKAFCRQADFITVPIEGAKGGFYPEFQPKIHVIPQAFRFPGPEDLSEYSPNPVPTFAFAGTFIPGTRDPRPLLRYLSTIDRRFRFVVFTRQADLIQPFREILRDSLEINDFVPRGQLLRTLSTMDFLVNLENRTTLQSPSKLIDYAICKRPILSIDPMALDTQKVERFLSADYTHQADVGPMSQYDIQNVAQQFLNLINI